MGGCGPITTPRMRHPLKTRPAMVKVGWYSTAPRSSTAEPLQSPSTGRGAPTWSRTPACVGIPASSAGLAAVSGRTSFAVS